MTGVSIAGSSKTPLYEIARSPAETQKGAQHQRPPVRAQHRRALLTNFLHPRTTRLPVSPSVPHPHSAHTNLAPAHRASGNTPSVARDDESGDSSPFHAAPQSAASSGCSARPRAGSSSPSDLHRSLSPEPREHQPHPCQTEPTPASYSRPSAYPDLCRL